MRTGKGLSVRVCVLCKFDDLFIIYLFSDLWGEKILFFKAIEREIERFISIFSACNFFFQFSSILFHFFPFCVLSSFSLLLTRFVSPLLLFSLSRRYGEKIGRGRTT